MKSRSFSGEVKCIQSSSSMNVDNIRKLSYYDKYHFKIK